MAAQRKASTIAFPAFGRGRLAFSAKDVVECFVQAKQTTQTTIKVNTIMHTVTIKNPCTFTENIMIQILKGNKNLQCVWKVFGNFEIVGFKLHTVRSS